jgi:hypothetical protein
LLSFVALAWLALSGAGIHAQAPPSDALPYSKGYLVTGNYVASGVDLTEQANPIDANGFSTGTIHINGVPRDADIVAAYMYFETITLTSDLSEAAGVTFRGQTVLLNDLIAVKKSSQLLTGSSASCWSSGVPLTMTMVRVDVLRWLPIRPDKDDKPTGKRIVNDADLTAHGLPLHQVKLPVRTGNQVPESAGASLVLVYRDPAEPLRKIVLYDGLHIQSSVNELTTQSLRGFYRSYLTSSPKSAQITHIVGAGQPNKYERIFFDDGSNTQISPADPINGASSSQRTWSTLTYDVSALMNPGNNSLDGYGETATTRIDHNGGAGGYDCLALGAVVFSTAVADVDHDGLPDGLENAVGGLKDPDGQPLPNLKGMGAGSDQKDLFIEFNGLWAPAGTSYGSAAAPFNPLHCTPLDTTGCTSTDPNGHNHTPTPEMLKMIGDAYLAHGVRAHFDVGSIEAYHAANDGHDPKKLGVVTHVDWVDDYTSTQADAYLVKSEYARGGEVIKEAACDRAIATCQFPEFPGTVGWKLGLQIYRDAPVDDNGEEVSLTPTDPGYFNWDSGTHRRRFDRNRFGLFHYVLYAHARGTPRSALPCLTTGGVPGPFDAGGGTSCVVENPDFHAPSSRSGVADLPGGNVLVTLGLWDDFVGRPYVRAATTFHEMGHNLNLWHGGQAAIWGNKYPLVGTPTSTYIEPNCKPNYLSSMSYLFQVAGLFDDSDNIHLDYSDRDYSGAAFNSLNETGTLSDVIPPEPPPSLYIPAWFAPATSPLAVDQGASAAGRFCDGSKFDPHAPPAPRARVHATDLLSPIDWDGDPGTTLTGQNVNFDGTPDGVPTLSSALLGFNDWANIRLDQISAGRHAVKFQNGDFADFGSGDFIDFGSGDFTDYGSGDFIDFGSGDFIDFGSGDFIDYGSGVFQNAASGDFVDFGSGDFTDFGSGDFTDFGSGDFLDFGTGSERQELAYDAAKLLAKSAPYALTACVIGTPGCTAGTPYTPQYHRVELHLNSSTVGHIVQYIWERKQGNAASASPYVPAGTSLTTAFIDFTELQDGTEYTYRARTQFDDTDPPFSPWSKPVTVTAVNERPVSNADNYSTNEDTPLIVTAAGVLGNDTDVDSPALTVDLSSVIGPFNGALTMSANGSFVYTPNLNFFGSDSFTYKAKDAFRDSSAAATVSITVYPVNDAPSFSFTASPPVDTVGKGSGPRVVLGWVTVSPGPANSTPPAVPPASESGQAVDFNGLVTNNNNALFSVQPAISPAGTLTYTPASNKSGVATVTVRIHDNGGTDNGHGGGGVDTSAPKTFTISVVPSLK